MNILAAFWPHGFLILVLIAISALLMLVILIQKGRGGGLSGAFGGGGGGSAAFGTKTGDVFTWITIGLASLFALVTIAANYVFDQSAAPSVMVVPAAPAATPTGVQGTTDSGVPVSLGEIPEGWKKAGEPGEGSEGATTTPVETPADAGSSTTAPPTENPPATSPTGTEPPKEPDGGGTPAP